MSSIIFAGRFIPLNITYTEITACKARSALFLREKYHHTQQFLKDNRFF